MDTEVHAQSQLSNTLTRHFSANVCFALYGMLLVVNQWKVKVVKRRNTKKRTSACRAGLSIVPVVPWEGPPPRGKGAPADQLSNFYHAVLTFERSVYA